MAGIGKFTDFEEDEQKRRFAGLKLPREDRLKAAIVRAETHGQAKKEKGCNPSGLQPFQSHSAEGKISNAII